jgi:hypothetical protein
MEMRDELLSVATKALALAESNDASAESLQAIQDAIKSLLDAKEQEELEKEEMENMRCGACEPWKCVCLAEARIKQDSAAV